MKIYANRLGRLSNKSDLEILDALIGTDVWVKVFINYPIGSTDGYFEWWRINQKYLLWGRYQYDYDKKDQYKLELNLRVDSSEFDMSNVHIVRPLELVEDEDQIYFD